MTLRVLIAVTHLLGAGHLTRAAAIARALARAGHEVTLVSGGASSGLVDLRGVSLVQLPPVRVTADSFTDLLDERGGAVGPEHLAVRRDMLLDTFATFRPDIVVTELFPFGRRVLAAEFGALVAAVRQGMPRPLLVSSVRDILVAPAKPSKLDAAHALLRAAFDAVLVHGDEGVVPLAASWPLAPDLASLLIYTGYVDGSSEPAPARAGPPEGGPVLVSGGSSAASLPLYRAALEAARIATRRPWCLLVGHGVEPSDFDALRRQAPDRTRVERARPDFRAQLSEAAVFVGQAGYNTVMDILATRVRAVLVPFEHGQETEQRLRAAELSRRGFADLLPESQLSGAALANRVEAAAERPRPDPSGIHLDGADRSAAILAGLFEARQRGRGREVRR